MVTLLLDKLDHLKSLFYVFFGGRSKWKVKSLSRVRPSATPWTAAFQAPPSMGFSRQEHQSGVPLPSPLGRSKVAVTLGPRWPRAGHGAWHSTRTGRTEGRWRGTDKREDGPMDNRLIKIANYKNVKILWHLLHTTQYTNCSQYIKWSLEPYETTLEVSYLTD